MKKIFLYAGLLLGGMFVPCVVANTDKKTKQKIVRKQREAYRYVQDVISPPAVDHYAVDNPMLKRLKESLRIPVIIAGSLVASKVLIWVISHIPAVDTMIKTTEERVRICSNMYNVLQQARQKQNALVECLTRKGRLAEAAALSSEEAALPGLDLDQVLLGIISEKTALDNAFGTIEKALAALLFLIFYYRFSYCNNTVFSYFSGDWTYFGILEKIVKEWPEHRCHFPPVLRMQFELFYNAYVACGDVLDMTEEDAQSIIEAVSLESIAELDMLYLG